MNSRDAFLISAFGLASVTALLQAAETSFILPAEIVRLKPGPGVELVNAQCLLCHSADYISTQPRLTDAQWKAVVSKMREKYGAPIATNKVDELVKYLAEHYGIKKGAPPAKD
jgi:hypothetical protein